jgi:hypothetical protein
MGGLSGWRGRRNIVNIIHIAQTTSTRKMTQVLHPWIIVNIIHIIKPTTFPTSNAANPTTAPFRK